MLQPWLSSFQNGKSPKIKQIFTYTDENLRIYRANSYETWPRCSYQGPTKSICGNFENFDFFCRFRRLKGSKVRILQGSKMNTLVKFHKNWPCRFSDFRPFMCKFAIFPVIFPYIFPKKCVKRPTSAGHISATVGS